jgi:hypothetical protein
MTVKSGAQKVSAALKQMFEGPHSDGEVTNSHANSIATRAVTARGWLLWALT